MYKLKPLRVFATKPLQSEKITHCSGYKKLLLGWEGQIVRRFSLS
ncbi:MAG: hypothetical protein OFPI_03170 [Osedax symbiont Rs2]|nr:MAG: hypothetical protein OFPI_03170 [Osedax symbiont Rs2]